MIRYPLSILIVLLMSAVVLCPGPASADTYPNGYSHDGYTYNNGYWWYGKQAYSRSKSYYPQTYSKTWYSSPYGGGYYQYVADPLKYYYSYTEIPTATYTPPAYTPPTIKSSTTYSGWEQALLDIAKSRDQAEHAMRKTALDHQRYLEAIKALGLESNFRMQGYGSYSVAPPVNPYASPYYPKSSYSPGYGGYSAPYSYAPVQGLTTYGYSVNTTKEAYGATDLNTLYQQAARLAQNSQSLAGQATGDFQGLVGDAGQNAARVAEILAKAQAAKVALEAANLPPSTRTTTTVTGTGIASSSSGTAGSTVGAGGLRITSPATGATVDPALGATLKTYCASCHSSSSEKPRGEFRTENYGSLSPEQKVKLISERLLTKDDKMRMPPPPAPPLPPQEVSNFLK